MERQQATVPAVPTSPPQAPVHEGPRMATTWAPAWRSQGAEARELLERPGAWVRLLVLQRVCVPSARRIGEGRFGRGTSGEPPKKT